MVKKHRSNLPAGSVTFILLNERMVPLKDKVGYLYRGTATDNDGTKLGAYNVLVSLQFVQDGAPLAQWLDAAANYVAADGDIASFDTEVPRLLISTNGLQVAARTAHEIR